MADQIPTVPPPGSNIWPPAPSGPGQPVFDPLEFGDIREFQTQNGLLMFFLMIGSFGIYGPFWMIKTAKVLNRIAPEREIPTGMIWTLLAFMISSYILTFGVSFFTRHLTSQSATVISAMTNAYSWAEAFYWWYMVFRFRSAFNAIIRQTSPNLLRFGVLGTFFFGELYLQVALNNRVRQRKADVLKMV